MLNEDAVAYGFIYLVLFLFIGGLIWVAVAPIVNIASGIMNEDVANHEVSEQTMQAVNFNKMFFEFGILLFMVVSAFVYAIVRALYKRDTSSPEG